jgi:hypothetical protein
MDIAHIRYLVRFQFYRRGKVELKSDY